MSQKYLSTYGIWVNCEEDETVGSVPTEQQIDNIASDSIVGKTEVVSDGTVQQEVVAAEEEETIAETQEVLEDLVDENEEKIEEAPETVTEEVVQQSNETLLLCLGRLGFGTADVSKLKLGFESYNTPLDNLKTTNRSIKNVLKKIRQVKKNIRLSKEYTQFDWARLLVPFNSLYRALFVNKTSTVRHPGILISFMLNHKNLISDVLDASDVGIIDLVNELQGKGRRASARGLEAWIEKVPNMYYEVFVNTSKTFRRNIKEVKQDIEDFKQLIIGIKATYCKKVSPYTLSTAQISDMKKFKPEKAGQDMQEANQTAGMISREAQQVVNDFAKWWTSNVIEYIAGGVEAL